MELFWKQESVVMGRKNRNEEKLLKIEAMKRDKRMKGVLWKGGLKERELDRGEWNKKLFDICWYGLKDLRQVMREWWGIEKEFEVGLGFSLFVMGFEAKQEKQGSSLVIEAELV